MARHNRFRSVGEYLDWQENVDRFNTPQPGEKFCEADFVNDPIAVSEARLERAERAPVRVEPYDDSLPF